MAGAPGIAVRIKQRIWQWFTGLGITQLRQGLILAILAVTALFGGLDTVNTKVTEVKPGKEFNDGALTVTVHRATLVTQLTAGDRVLLKADPGAQFLAVVATVKNPGNR
ncbi:hypothetical protein [Mycobacterium hubeiense]|uniref:hypothetical protein n=1 Tax=Mycobacterium hubeiense TaxID=1867256 RepID=UPI00130441E3|nr:hypothetical protein [Mycobacterium sp. QGD 101]